MGICVCDNLSMAVIEIWVENGTLFDSNKL